MSYFKELKNNPDVVWSITRYNVITKESKEWNNIFASYDIAINELLDYCDRMGYRLYETHDETQFVICEQGLKAPSYTVTIYARKFVK